MTVSLLARLALDLLAVAALVYGLFLPRHRRMDLVVVYALFNIGLFLALVVISAGEVSMGVGFGLFAVLSIVRLRSEPFSNRELAYFFVAIVLALVCAIDIGNLRARRRARRHRPARRLGRRPPAAHRPAAHARHARADLRRRHALHDHSRSASARRVLDATVLEVDYVRETTIVDVRSRDRRERRPGHVAVVA